MMEIEKYKHLWDGSQKGWSLHHIDSVSWSLIFRFKNETISNEQIRLLYKIIPELAVNKFPDVYKKLKNQSSYCVHQRFGNIQAREIANKARSLGFHVDVAPIQEGGYIPVLDDKKVLSISDNNIMAEVIRRMLDAKVPVVEIHVD